MDLSGRSFSCLFSFPPSLMLYLIVNICSIRVPCGTLGALIKVVSDVWVLKDASSQPPWRVSVVLAWFSVIGPATV